MELMYLQFLINAVIIMVKLCCDCYWVDIVAAFRMLVVHYILQNMLPDYAYSPVLAELMARWLEIVKKYGKKKPEN